MNPEPDAVEAACDELRAAGMTDDEVAGYRKVLAESVGHGWPSAYMAEQVRFKLLLRERRQQ